MCRDAVVQEAQERQRVLGLDHLESRLVPAAQPSIGVRQGRESAPGSPLWMSERVNSCGADALEGRVLQRVLADPAADSALGVRGA